MRVQKLELIVQGLEYNNQSLGVSIFDFRSRSQGLEFTKLVFRLQALGCRIWGLGSRVQLLGFKFQFGNRILEFWELGFKKQGLELLFEQAISDQRQDVVFPKYRIRELELRLSDSVLNTEPETTVDLKSYILTPQTLNDKTNLLIAKTQNCRQTSKANLRPSKSSNDQNI